MAASKKPNKTSAKKPAEKKAAPKKIAVKKSFLKRFRNITVYSLLLIIIGFSIAKYQTEIYEFTIGGGYQQTIHRVKNIGQTTKEFYTPRSSSVKSSPQKSQISKETKSALIPIENEIVKHKYYVLGYNEDREQPNWVAYKLTKEMILNKKVKRKNNFRPDPLVTTGSAELSDYRKSGYDRGHLCPAAPMAFDKTAMSETFYMSNMSPQKPDFNRGGWKNLESKVRGWAVKNKGISVVTGSIFYNNRTQKEIGRNGVDVPDAYYKVILDYTKPDIKAIGFIMPNKKIDKPLSYYAVPVNNVEKITGIDFFKQLPDNVEEKLESSSDYNRWN